MSEEHNIVLLLLLTSTPPKPKPALDHDARPESSTLDVAYFNIMFLLDVAYLQPVEIAAVSKS
jgi:hypothetical protein